MKDIYQREKYAVSLYEPKASRAVNLTARAEIFRELIQLPRLVACMEYLLGTDYVLCDMGARSPMPGIGPQEDPATRSCDWSGLLSSYTLGR